MDYAIIRAELIKTIEDDLDAELLESTATEINMFDSAYGKYIRFRIAPHSRESAKELIHFGQSLQEGPVEQYKDKIAGILLELDPCVLLTLKNILIVQTADDLHGLCKKLNLDDELLPESLPDSSEELDPNLMGISWFYESSIIINISGIEQASEDICGSRDAPDYAYEVEFGFWTTLLHEIRHNQMDCCPYELPWIQEGDDSEEQVEKWAMSTFKNLHIC